jgi:NAD+ synthase
MDTNCFSEDWLRIDPERESARIEEYLRQILARDLKRRGLVIGLSGGVDSTVTAALAARALGKSRVLGLLMPERQSGRETPQLSRLAADFLGIERHEQDITAVLEAVGFYDRYQNAVRQVLPDFGEGWESKIITPDVTAGEGYTFFILVARAPDGAIYRQRLPHQAYLEIVAATNFKQRSRKMLEYYHADRLNYAVCGTPNRLEYDQGFFVKNGDGAADVKPIAHLYKSQVYQLAEYFQVPAPIRQRLPTTDTYSMEQGQDEFYFSLPYRQMDLCLLGKNHHLDAAAVARAAGLTPEAVQRVWHDIDRKRATTRYLHLKALLIEAVPEVDQAPEPIGRATGEARAVG